MNPMNLRDLSFAQLANMAEERFAHAIEDDDSTEEDNREVNDLNRHAVAALAREQGSAFLGVFWPHKDVPAFRPWEGEYIPAFWADFVVPTLDKELVRFVEDMHADRGSHALLNAIMRRIKEVGGMQLLWLPGDRPWDDDSGEPGDEPHYDLGEPW
jgi:hypothetical protein